MKNVFVLLLLALLATSCSAIKGLRKRETRQQDFQPELIQELQDLSQQKLPKLDLRRKLHFLFEKYQIHDSDRRRLFFFDILSDLDADRLIEIITVLSDLFGEDEDGNDKGGGKLKDDGSNTIEVQPGSVVATNQVTTYTVTAPDGTVTTYTETTNQGTTTVTGGTQFVAGNGNGKKGRGAKR